MSKIMAARLGEPMRNLLILAVLIFLPNFAWAAADEGWGSCGGRDALEAKATCTALIDSGITGDQLANAFLGRGNAYVHLLDYDLAIADYTEAISLKSDFAWAYQSRATIYYLKGDYDHAISDYDDAIRSNPAFAEAFVGRGTVKYYKGALDSAIADYGKAILLNPNFSSAFFSRAVAYYSEGDLDSAIADLDDAIRLEPDQANAYAVRGVCRWYLGQQDYALIDLEQALKLNPALAYAKAKLQEFQNDIEAGKRRRSTVHIAGRRVALVIGNSEYEFLPQLPNAVSDAASVRDALISLGYQVTFLHDLHRDEIVSALRKFGTETAPSAETAMIWYTGHGQSFNVDDGGPKGTALQSENFILPIEYRPDDNIATHGIILGEVIGGVLSANTLQVVAVDACRGLGEDANSAGFSGIAKPSAPANGVQPLTDRLYVIYSTLRGHSSSDGVPGQHSPFAQAFLNEIASGYAKNDVRAFFGGVTHETEKTAKSIGQDQTPDPFDSIDSGAQIALAK